MEVSPQIQTLLQVKVSPADILPLLPQTMLQSGTALPVAM